jgi:type I restriction enzyme S subunit
MSSNWPEVLLGEVIREEREAVGSADGEELPVLGVTNIEGVTQTGIEASADRSKYLRLHPGRFVYNPYRINVGSIGLSGPSQNGICSPAYVVFAPTERIDPHFLRFFLKSARGNQLINFHGNRGSVRSALRFDDLCKIEIPLPPIEEQKLILVRIKDLAVQICEVQVLRRQAVEEAEALVLRSRAVQFEKLAAHFATRPLGELISMTSGEGLTSSQMDDSAPYPVYGGGGLNGRYSHYLFEEPKIVIGRVGARCGCVFVTEPKAWVTDNALYLTKISDELHAPYLVHALTILDLRQQANQAAQPVVSQKKINPIRIPVPPLPEQRRVVAELDALQTEVDALKRLQAETAATLDALLPSVLDRAFKGEL